MALSRAVPLFFRTQLASPRRQQSRSNHGRHRLACFTWYFYVQWGEINARIRIDAVHRGVENRLRLPQPTCSSKSSRSPQSTHVALFHTGIADSLQRANMSPWCHEEQNPPLRISHQASWLCAHGVLKYAIASKHEPAIRPSLR